MTPKHKQGRSNCTQTEHNSLGSAFMSRDVAFRGLGMDADSPTLPYTSTEFGKAQSMQQIAIGRGNFRCIRYQIPAELHVLAVAERQSCLIVWYQLEPLPYLPLQHARPIWLLDPVLHAVKGEVDSELSHRLRQQRET